MADLLSGVWAEPARTAGLTPREWESLLGQARRGRLLGRLALLTQGASLQSPSPPCDYLAGALRVVSRQRLELLNELAHLRRALEGLDVPVVLLKGAAYSLAQLPPSRGRLFSDIDLMVPRAAVDGVEQALQASGWISQERDTYNQRYYREWMHEIPPLEHLSRGSVIDLHHTIAPPTSRFRIDGALLMQRIRPIGRSGFHMLSPEDMVLHSAVHLYQEGEFDHGLRDLLDLHDLLQHFGSEPDFWPSLLARAVELRVGEPLYLLLQQRQRVLGAVVPAAIQADVEALRPGWLKRTAVTALLTQALRPHHPDCDTVTSDLARWLLYVRSHQLRMPLRLLIPHLLRKAWMARFGTRSGSDTAEA